MTKEITISTIAFCLISTVALAGTVHFDPPSATITPGTPIVSFEVSVSWDTLPTIDTVNVVIQADDGVGLGFDFAQSFVDSTTIPPAPPVTGWWYCDFAACSPMVGFGGNRLPPASGWTLPLLVGTLTVDTSRMLAQDQIDVFVDSQWEVDMFGAAISLVQDHRGIQEPLSGAATITVVPEPTTAALLLVLGAAGLGWRRRVIT